MKTIRIREDEYERLAGIAEARGLTLGEAYALCFRDPAGPSQEPPPASPSATVHDGPASAPVAFASAPSMREVATNEDWEARGVWFGAAATAVGALVGLVLTGRREA